MYSSRLLATDCKSSCFAILGQPIFRIKRPTAKAALFARAETSIRCVLKNNFSVEGHSTIFQISEYRNLVFLQQY